MPDFGSSSYSIGFEAIVVAVAIGIALVLGAIVLMRGRIALWQFLEATFWIGLGIAAYQASSVPQLGHFKEFLMTCPPGAAWRASIGALASRKWWPRVIYAGIGAFLWAGCTRIVLLSRM